MAPRSPTVQPGLSGLAQALLGGVKGYQGQVDRDRVEEERQLGRSIKLSTEADRQRASDTDFVMKGGMPTLGGALQANPQAMQAPQFVPNAPNDFDRTTKQFRQSAISPTDEVAVRGGTVNPMLPAQRQLEMAKMGRADIRGETAQALGMGGVQAPAGTEYFPNAAAQYFMPEDDANWQFIPENYGSPARLFNRKTQQVRLVPGSNPLPRASAGAGGAGGDPNQIMRLRTDYRLQPAVKNARTIQTAYERIQNTQDNAVGDLSLIFAYMKMLDPESVVRETEFANAQNAAGVPDQVRNVWNRVLEGERLNPNQRAQFRSQARDLVTGAQAGLNRTNEEYRRLAAAFGVDPTLIFSDTKTPEDNADDIESELAMDFGLPPSKRKP